jgi:hypothetical protein
MTFKGAHPARGFTVALELGLARIEAFKCNNRQCVSLALSFPPATLTLLDRILADPNQDPCLF